jgi:hypothetical protein
MWHSIKRNSSNFWHRIGPLGRNFLRQVGPAALQMATTGGLNSSAIKNLLKHTAKSMGRQRIKEVVYQGVQRLLQGQIDIALAAGVDICDPESEETAAAEGKTTENGHSGGKRTWICEDKNGIMRDFNAQAEGPDAKILEKEFTFTVLYDDSQETADLDYYFFILMERGIWQEDGSLDEWHEVTTEYNINGSIDRVLDNGYFETTLTGKEFRKDTFLGSEVTLDMTSNMFGLINPDDINYIYICEIRKINLPSHNENATPANFKALCGYSYYYECTLE